MYFRNLLKTLDPVHDKVKYDLTLAIIRRQSWFLPEAPSDYPRPLVKSEWVPRKWNPGLLVKSLIP